jgi:tRNA 2-thiouridine synthesizing protein B
MLHTVNKSPFERNSLESCLRLSQDGCAVLVFEDAVYAVLKGTKLEATITEALKTKKVYVLLPDDEARGMRVEDVISGVQSVDYTGFVDLVAENNAVQAWL